MNYGAILAEDTYYCLIPQDRTNVLDHPMIPDGPSARTALRDDNGWLKNYLGQPMMGTRVVLEEDIWTPGDVLVIVGKTKEEHLPICPVRLDFLRLPTALLSQVLPNITADFGDHDVVFRLDWCGIVCRRKYRIALLPVGLAVWPPKELPDWSPYFILLSPAADAADGPPLFQTFKPVIYSASQHWNSGQVRIYDGRFMAMAKTDRVPELLGFIDSRSSPSEALGFHLLGSGTAGLDFMRPAAWLASRRGEDKISAHTDGNIRVAIDFGTSNTSVAVSRAGETNLVNFTDKSCARLLTSSIGLNPYSYQRTHHRFFPTEGRLQLQNPLPTIVYDLTALEPGLSAFEGSYSLPSRLILPPSEATRVPNWIEDEVAQGTLKQDFKWAPDDEGDPLRRAFLEQLALIVAYQLRSDKPALPRKVEILATFPLAFSNQRSWSLKKAVEVVRRTLESAGFPEVEVLPLLSESLANYSYFASAATQSYALGSGRVAVIDVGGGTTDISVFTENGNILFLDSLLIGGRDFAQSLLRYRIERQGKWDQVKKAFGLRRTEPFASEGGWQAVHYILIQELGRKGATEVQELLRSNGMVDVLGELVGLLLFAAAYAVRLGLQPDPSQVKRLHVWFCGLGSRLLDLCPPYRNHIESWSAVKAILEKVLKTLPETAHLGTEISIERISNPKEAVCLGAAAYRRKEHNGTDKTIWWADIPRSGGLAPIGWGENFDRKIALSLEDVDIEQADVSSLSQLAEAVISSVGPAIFEENWVMHQEAQAKLANRFKASYCRACVAIRDDRTMGTSEASSAPPHPAGYVPIALKELICEAME